MRIRLDYRCIVLLSLALILLVAPSTLQPTQPSQTPFDIAKTHHQDDLKQHYFITMDQVENYFIIVSNGLTDDSTQNVYFVDIIEETNKGYKWVDGTSHTYHDSLDSFDFSLQLFNSPTISSYITLGIIKEPELKDLKIVYEKTYSPLIYIVQPDEFFYITHFEKGIHFDRDPLDYLRLYVLPDYQDNQYYYFNPLSENETAFKNGQPIYVSKYELIH